MQAFDETTVFMTVGYLLLTLTSIGLLSEQNPWGYYFELVRSALFLALSRREEADSEAEGSLYTRLLGLYALPSFLIWLFVLSHRALTVGNYRLTLKNQLVNQENGSNGTSAPSIHRNGTPKDALPNKYG